MKSIGYVHWQDGDMWLGYLENFPDYMTQGKSLAELEENLREIYNDCSAAAVPPSGKFILATVPNSVSPAPS